MVADHRNKCTAESGKWWNRTNIVLVRAHVLSKFGPTQFIGPKKAEVTRYLPHNGGCQSLVETQGAICLQHCLHYCPHSAEVTPQKHGQTCINWNECSLSYNWFNVNMYCLFHRPVLVTPTFSVHLRPCQIFPFRAWLAADISPARWDILPWRRRWRLKTLQMPSEYHWGAKKRSTIEERNNKGF